jgi:acetyl/propionyl-CoA carboxylase alpha subunit
VRDDGGVYEDWDVSIYYDPMISKFSTYGRDRTEAINRMRRALREYRIDGIKTTLPFFREVMEDQEFVDGTLDTGFIPRFMERREAAQESVEVRDLAIIAAAVANANNSSAVPQAQAEQGSRWAMAARMDRLGIK